MAWHLAPLSLHPTEDESAVPDTRTPDQLAQPGDIVLLTTDDLRARPMTVQLVEDTTVWFLTDNTADWVQRLSADDTIGIGRQDEDEQLWFSLVGRVHRTQDRVTLQRLWDAVELAWFDGPEDPRLVALRITVDNGEWWDAPSGLVARALKLGRAIIDDEDDVGHQGNVTSN